MKNKMRGFSLIEALVVITVIGVIGTIMVDLLFRTISGGNKTQLIGAIKQNGQTALSNLQTTIIDADSVVCTNTDGSTSTLTIVKNGVYTRFRMYFDTTSLGSNCQSSGNGCIEEDSPKIDTSTSAPDLQTQIQSFCTSPQQSPSYLTDTNNVTIKNGSFTDNTSPGSKDIVGINFTMSAGKNLNFSSANPLTFSTSVELR